MENRLMKNYCIKPDYKSREKISYFDARSSKDEYQDNIYKKMKDFFVANKLNSILDVGCGSGFKLIKYFQDFSIAGTEVEPTLSFLKITYPNHIWYLSDFSKKLDKEFDFVCAMDVVEHLIDPDEMLEFMIKNSNQYVGISTPDRDALACGKNGPPNNPFHIREWTYSEFKDYISCFLKILIHEKTFTGQQYVICEKR